MMKNSLKIRLKKIESCLGDLLKPRGIFLQTKKVNGQMKAWFIDVSIVEKHPSFYLAIVFPVKDSDENNSKSLDPYFHRVTEEYLIKQPAIAQLLREENYI